MTVVRGEYCGYREVVQGVLGHNAFTFRAPKPGEDSWLLQISSSRLFDGVEHRIGEIFHIVQRETAGGSVFFRLVPRPLQSRFVS